MRGQIIGLLLTIIILGISGAALADCITTCPTVCEPPDSGQGSSCTKSTGAGSLTAFINACVGKNCCPVIGTAATTCSSTDHVSEFDITLVSFQRDTPVAGQVTFTYRVCERTQFDLSHWVLGLGQINCLAQDKVLNDLVLVPCSDGSCLNIDPTIQLLGVNFETPNGVGACPTGSTFTIRLDESALASGFQIDTGCVVAAAKTTNEDIRCDKDCEIKGNDGSPGYVCVLGPVCKSVPTVEIDCEESITATTLGSKGTTVTLLENGSSKSGVTVTATVINDGCVSVSPGSDVTDANGEVTFTVTCNGDCVSNTKIEFTATVDDQPVKCETTITCSIPQIITEVDCDEEAVTVTVTGLSSQECEGIKVTATSSNDSCVTVDGTGSVTTFLGSDCRESFPLACIGQNCASNIKIELRDAQDNLLASDETCNKGCPGFSLGCPGNLVVQSGDSGKSVTVTAFQDGNPVDGVTVTATPSDDCINVSPGSVNTSNGGKATFNVTCDGTCGPGVKITFTATFSGGQTAECEIPVDCASMTCEAGIVGNTLVPTETTVTVTVNGIPQQGVEITHVVDEPDCITVSPASLSTDSNGEVKFSVQCKKQCGAEITFMATIDSQNLECKTLVGCSIPQATLEIDCNNGTVTVSGLTPTECDATTVKVTSGDPDCVLVNGFSELTIPLGSDCQASFDLSCVGENCSSNISVELRANGDLLATGECTKDCPAAEVPALTPLGAIAMAFLITLYGMRGLRRR